MASKPIVSGIQDVPPPGGYPKVASTRGIKPRGPSGFVIWGTILGLSAYGFHKIGDTNAERRFLRKETRECRMAILPYLQVERDRKLAQSLKLAMEKEAEIMSGKKDWHVGESVYSKRWGKPTNKEAFL